MSTIKVMEAANLFAGSDPPNASNHLALTELKLPAIEEAFSDHIAGGAPVAIRIDTHVNALDATFNLLGWNVQVMALMRSWVQTNQHFTARGLIRDRMTGKAEAAEAVMWGRLGRMNPQAYSRNNLQQHEHAINAITHYELKLGDNEIYYWDFFTNEFRVMGVDRNRETNEILLIPGQGVVTRFEQGGQISQGNTV
jgi:uncharacterized protein